VSRYWDEYFDFFDEAGKMGKNNGTYAENFINRGEMQL
jgi:hypothetical protein